jgi:hypothetical protein
MRTTVDIDDDLLEKLKSEAGRSRSSLRATVNRVLRAWVECFRPEKVGYRTPTFSMGFPPLASTDKALQLAAALDDDEVARKLELRK